MSELVLTGNKVVTGAALALTNQANAKRGLLTVVARSTNTGTIRFGSATVLLADDPLLGGFPLAPGASFTFPLLVKNGGLQTNKLFFIGPDAGEIVDFVVESNE